MNSEQYCGNKIEKEVHDLDKEQTNCRIDEILIAGNDVHFDTLTEAHAAGYDNCDHCLNGSTT